MSEQMPYADIVIMALVAGFILLRLRSVLGQKTGRDKPDDFRPATPSEAHEPVIAFPDRMQRRQPEAEKPAPAEDAIVGDNAVRGVEAIAATDPQFTASSFLQGAKAAFEMVFEAFIKGDKQTLKTLLSPDIYNDFAADLDAKKDQETRSEATLVSVESVHIEAAEKDKNIARVTVKFVSEQITVMRNKEGKIVEGDPSQVDRVEDEWVFERDVTSRNPNWKITAV